MGTRLRDSQHTVDTSKHVVCSYASGCRALLCAVSPATGLTVSVRPEIPPTTYWARARDASLGGVPWRAPYVMRSASAQCSQVNSPFTSSTFWLCPCVRMTSGLGQKRVTSGLGHSCPEVQNRGTRCHLVRPKLLQYTIPASARLVARLAACLASFAFPSRFP